MGKRNYIRYIVLAVVLCAFVGIIGYVCAERGKSLLSAEHSVNSESPEQNNSAQGEENGRSTEEVNRENEKDSEDDENEKDGLILAEGKTLESRVSVPKGYKRTACKQGSLGSFLRSYPLKKDGRPVLLYDGSKKGNQSVHAAVFKLPIEAEDLQQCADSVMRVYAEYFWKTGQKERIKFHFVDGFLADYTKWRDGGRIQVGNTTSWVNSAAYDDSYENFKKYMRIVFAYAGTLSMEAESERISLEKLRIGDIFIKGASPGHVVMVVDICKNAEGKKAFLLGQGYMPAQEFHLLKNPRHEEDDPWYYEDEVSYPFETPEYTFEKGSLRRLKY